MSNRESKDELAPLGSSGGKKNLTILGVFLFLSLWLILSSTNAINSLILPSPFRVIGAVTDVGFDLVYHIIATLGRVILGLSLGCLIGIFLGAIMQFNRTVYVLLDGIIETFRPVPPVALIPFFILIFGFSEAGKIVIVTLGVTLIMVVSTVEAFERVPIGVMRWGLISQLSRYQLFTLVLFPAAWPELRTGFRISLAIAITLVIVSEFMGAKYGLGYLISVSKVTLTTPTIFLSVILLGWVGCIMDRGIRYLFDKTCAWDVRAKGAVI